MIVAWPALLIVYSLLAIAMIVIFLWMRASYKILLTRRVEDNKTNNNKNDNKLPYHAIQAYNIAIDTTKACELGSNRKFYIFANVLDGAAFVDRLQILIKAAQVSQKITIIMANSVIYATNVKIEGTYAIISFDATGPLLLPGKPTVSSACPSNGNVFAWMYLS